MADNSMDTTETANVDQDIDETINELSELVKDDANVEDKEDEEMDDSSTKEKESTEEKKESDEKAEDASKKKKKKQTQIDKTVRPPLVRVIQGQVIIKNFKMKDAKMKDFLTVLSKAESFVFEYNMENVDENRVGKITLNYGPKKDFKAFAIIHILADLMDFNPELEIEAPELFRNELDAELYGVRRSSLSQSKDKTLYVNEITNDTTEEFLRALVPDSTKAYIPVDSDGNRRGWAVLEFRNAKDADECMKTVKMIELGTDNAVMITRAEGTDAAVVEKAKEERNNQPPKRKKAEKTPAKDKGKDKKRLWNQGPGMSFPGSFGGGQGGFNRGGQGDWSPRGGGMNRGGGNARRMDFGGDRDRNFNQGFRNQMGNMGGSFNRSNSGGFGSQNQFNQGQFSSQGFGGRGDWGFQGQGGGYQQQQMRQNQGNFGGGGNADDDNMLDFLQSAIQEMKSKKSAQQKQQQQYGMDNWGGGSGGSNYNQRMGSGNYNQRSGGGYDNSFNQQGGFEQNPKRRRDNWNNSGGSGQNWNNSGNNRGQQQGLGVWKNQGGNQQKNKWGGGGSGYGGGGNYDSYNSYGGNY